MRYKSQDLKKKQKSLTIMRKQCIDNVCLLRASIESDITENLYIHPVIRCMFHLFTLFLSFRGRESNFFHSPPFFEISEGRFKAQTNICSTEKDFVWIYLCLCVQAGGCKCVGGGGCQKLCPLWLSLPPLSQALHHPG